jgi:hypothetical protein
MPLDICGSCAGSFLLQCMAATNMSRFLHFAPVNPRCHGSVHANILGVVPTHVVSSTCCHATKHSWQMQAGKYQNEPADMSQAFIICRICHKPSLYVGYVTSLDMSQTDMSQAFISIQESQAFTSLHFHAASLMQRKCVNELCCAHG